MVVELEMDTVHPPHFHKSATDFDKNYMCLIKISSPTSSLSLCSIYWGFEAPIYFPKIGQSRKVKCVYSQPFGVRVVLPANHWTQHVPHRTHFLLLNLMTFVRAWERGRVDVRWIRYFQNVYDKQTYDGYWKSRKTSRLLRSPFYIFRANSFSVGLTELGVYCLRSESVKAGLTGVNLGHIYSGKAWRLFVENNVTLSRE